MKLLLWVVLILVVAVVVAIAFINIENDLEEESIKVRTFNVSNTESQSFPLSDGTTLIRQGKYIVNDKRTPNIEMRRKGRYEFIVDSEEAMYFADSPIGTPEAENNIIPQSKPIANGKISLHILDNFPSVFYYVSTNPFIQGGKITIK